MNWLIKKFKNNSCVARLKCFFLVELILTASIDHVQYLLLRLFNSILDVMNYPSSRFSNKKLAGKPYVAKKVNTLNNSQEDIDSISANSQVICF
jgi:hypothetical protein